MENNIKSILHCKTLSLFEICVYSYGFSIKFIAESAVHHHHCHEKKHNKKEALSLPIQHQIHAPQ